MTAVLLDGEVIARHTYEQLDPRLRALSELGVRPGLATVCVGDDPASAIYARNKARACTAIGMHSEVHTLNANCTESTLLEKLELINRRPDIHGVIVQLPLPRQLNADRIQQAIAVDKDVDGFSWHHLGALVAGHPIYTPCTPLGVMAMLDYAEITIEGRRAVVVGRSVIVGKPMALLLMNRGATVTVCNSKTPDLAKHTANADILVAAIGRAGLITADMVKTGAAVIDVGINRLPNGKITGDVDFAAVQAKAGYLTPVPGGVGRMTVAMLIANTVKAAERQSGLTRI